MIVFKLCSRRIDSLDKVLVLSDIEMTEIHILKQMYNLFSIF